jgi:CheY-like chemotaxis protein
MILTKPILYAEDDPNDVFFMQRAFKQAGIVNPLHIVTNGTLAIDYLAGAGPYANREIYPLPCLVLLDLNMPGKSGLDVLKWIRTQPSVSTLPIVVITSSNQDSDIHRAYLLGANGYLIKPGKPDELLVMVKGIRDYWLAQNRSPASWVNLVDEQKSAPTNPQTE